MKILIVITKGEIGGAQTFVLTLAKALHKKGHTVTVGYGEGDYLGDALKKDGIATAHFEWLKRTKNPFANMYFGWELRKFLQENQFDVVHFNSTNALFGAIEARIIRPRIKIVFTIHGLSVIDPNYRAPKLMKFIYTLVFKFLFSLVDEKVFVSKTNLEYAKQIGLVKDAALIYNGIDSESLHFLPKEAARAFLSNLAQADIDDKYIIGSIGRLAYPKNYEFLIDVFPQILKEIPNAVAIIVGEGSERKRYEDLIKKNKLTNVIFLVGELTDAYRYIKAFDLFILPSEYEGMSMTLIEALFTEAPILASRVGGTPELLNDPAQTYTLNDAKDFITKIKATHARKETEFSEAQKAHRTQFNGNKMAEQYIKIYEAGHSS